MQPTIEGFRLSPPQRHLWQSGGAPGRVAGAALLAAPFDPQRLADALALVAEQHELLRSTVQPVPGMQLPIQVISALQARIEPPLDLRGRPEAEQRAAVAQGAAELAAPPFDPARGPLLRLRPAPLDEARFALLIAFPALAGDPRSLVNLAGALAAAYTGKAPAAETLQYVDASEWLHELLEAEESAAGRAFWEALDRDAPAGQTLPFERPAPAGAAFAPQAHDLALDAALLDRLAGSAAAQGQAAEDWLLAGWAALLARLTGRDALVLGLGVDGRPHDELRDGLGLYARTVPLQAAADTSLAFAAFAGALREQAGAAREWQLYYDSEPQGGAAGRAASFPLAFDLADLRGAPVELWALDACPTPCLLRLECVATDAGLSARLVYDAARLDGADVAGLGRALLALLADVAAAPERPLGELRLADDPGWQARLQPPPAPAPTACVHTLVAAGAARHPERAAVYYEDRSLSYAELDRQAEQIAARLRAAGVGREQVVALALGRSPEMVAAMLGVLKAGAAYLPIDPLWPEERVRLVLAESRAAALLSDELRLTMCDSATAPSTSDKTIVDRQSDIVDGLAYVLFTSGSTGTPRGVAIEHRQLSSYLASIQAALDLPEGAHYGLVSTFAADLGNTVIFPALCSGGTLHIISGERAADAAQLAAYLREHPIDCLKIVPSHLAALLSGPEAADVLPRRRLVLGGEALPWQLVERVRALRPDCSILNHYGPTETTVGVLTYPAAGGPPSASPTVPLGRPLPHSRVYVLDAALQPLPAWFPGEIYIGGAGLARGYLGRPELTAERFIPDPFGIGGAGEQNQEPRTENRALDSDNSKLKTQNSKLYRTGDLARMLPDGTVEFLGRIDGQIKLHGFRIEPGEIEAALLDHPSVAAAAVLLREDQPGDKRLVAYIVPAQRREGESTKDTKGTNGSGQEKLGEQGQDLGSDDAELKTQNSKLKTPAGEELKPQTSELREHLERRLPPQLLPQAIVSLAALPLTPNGKLDRRALPTPEQAGATQRAAFVAPRTPTEERLAAIWAELLRVDPLGVHDNFFEIGGHSLLATQVVSRVRERLGVDLPLRSLFEARTIADMAAVIDRRQAERADSSVEALAQDLADLPPEELAALLAELDRPGGEPRDG